MPNIIGIVIFTLDGQIVEANEAFLRIVGYGRADLVAGRLRWKYDARNAGIRGDLRHCASDRGRRSAPSATLGPDLSRAGGGISAGLDAEHCRLRHQNRPGTLLRDWSVGSTGRWLTQVYHPRYGV